MNDLKSKARFKVNLPLTVAPDKGNWCADVFEFNKNRVDKDFLGKIFNDKKNRPLYATHYFNKNDLECFILFNADEVQEYFILIFKSNGEKIAFNKIGWQISENEGGADIKSQATFNIDKDLNILIKAIKVIKRDKLHEPILCDFEAKYFIFKNGYEGNDMEKVNNKKCYLDSKTSLLILK